MPEDLKIAFIGAGGVNFGGAEGPWDHASRLETIGGLRVVGIADPDTGRAESILADRRARPSGAIYADARVLPDFRRLLEQTKPDIAFVGVPPNAHGGTDAPRDIELACAAAGVHMLVEKPLSNEPPERVQPVADALARAAGGGLIVSVGYMFRYARAVAAMQRVLAETPGGVRAVVARYNCAYSEIRKAAWWDVRQSGGPIVEQATHFCDLMRLLAGPVDLASVRATQVPATAGDLVDMPVLPDGRTVTETVPAAFRAPQATAAFWRFESGAIGSLAHGALLHRRKYESELEVWGDGLRMVLSDPYGDCRLSIRRPHGEGVEVLNFADDDPYMAEDQALIDAVRRRDPASIRSTYADAMETYELTWAIRRASEQ